jgi:hypothetical protein
VKVIFFRNADARLQPDLGAPPGCEARQVSRYGAASDEVGRSDDVDDVLARSPGLAEHSPDHVDDPLRPVRRPGSLPVRVAVDQADGHGRDLAPLSSQHNLAGR